MLQLNKGEDGKIQFIETEEIRKIDEILEN